MDSADPVWPGPSVDDPEIILQLPPDLRALLAKQNGFVRHGGGLHLRGACTAPQWHSLSRAWQGPTAFHEAYASVSPHWVPFGEDCVGDQFFLTEGTVLRLHAETGDVDDLACDLAAFLQKAQDEPAEFLQLAPLHAFQRAHGSLEPGQLILVYPPFCTQEARNGVSLRSAPSLDVHAFHADFARRLPRDGQQVRVIVTD